MAEARKACPPWVRWHSPRVYGPAQEAVRNMAGTVLGAAAGVRRGPVSGGAAGPRAARSRVAPVGVSLRTAGAAVPPPGTEGSDP